MTIPTSVAIAIVVAMTTSLACCGASAVGDQAMRRFMETDKRNHECAAQSTKCFNSRQCCDGFICAALDEDDGGSKPEVPGNCVKTKDLQACSVGGSGPGDECPSGHRCMGLGRMGQTYCLPVGMGAQQPDSRANKMTDRRRYLHGSGAGKATGKIGSTCVTDFDCAPRSEDGTQRMCCQLVNKGRQGTKRICDKVTPISTCTSA